MSQLMVNTITEYIDDDLLTELSGEINTMFKK